MSQKINLYNADNVNITCKRGDTFIIDAIRFYSDTAKTIPLDISSYTFAMKVKNAKDIVILSFTMTSGFTIFDTNALEIKKSGSEMIVDYTPTGQVYKYDLEMTDDTGIVTTVMYGNFIILNDVTNG